MIVQITKPLDPCHWGIITEIGLFRHLAFQFKYYLIFKIIIQYFQIHMVFLVMIILMQYFVIKNFMCADYKIFFAQTKNQEVLNIFGLDQYSENIMKSERIFQIACKLDIFIDKYLEMHAVSNHSLPLSSQEIEDEILWNSEASKENHLKSSRKIDITQVFKADQFFRNDTIVKKTPLTEAKELSQQYGAKIYLKREDQQEGKGSDISGKTYKIRGAYYYYLNNKNGEKFKQKGFVTVSDGNFSTSVAILCGIFKFKATIFVPESCISHKLEKMKKVSHGYAEIIQTGTTFEHSEETAQKYAIDNHLDYVQPHESLSLFAGFATVAKQLLDEKKVSKIDYVLVPSGGGALVSSIASFLKQIDPSIKIIAVEPSSCQPFADSLRNSSIIVSDTVSKFCHGSSVKKVGQWCFDIGRTSIDGFVNVTEKKLAQKIIKLYSMGFICEPSGALGVTALDKVKSEIKGKTVVCLITGANMELTKLEEAREMSMISKGYKNYYIVEVPNKKNSIYDLITKCFQVNDMISIQYNRKINKEASQALLAVESPTQENVENSIEFMKEMNYKFEIINDRGQLLDLFF